VSKKQIRLSDPLKVQQRLPEFLGKKINIVLKDNTVMFGELARIRETSIELINMRQKIQQVPIQNISELYSDIDASC
jgi:ribosome maturation factor RimP